MERIMITCPKLYCISKHKNRNSLQNIVNFNTSRYCLALVSAFHTHKRQAVCNQDCLQFLSLKLLFFFHWPSLPSFSYFSDLEMQDQTFFLPNEIYRELFTYFSVREIARLRYLILSFSSD